MTTLRQRIERQIKRLEDSGSDSPYLQDLKDQLAASDSKSTEELYYAGPLSGSKRPLESERSGLSEAPFKESEVTSYVNWEGRLAVIVGDSESSLDWPKPPAGVSMRPPLPGSSAAKGFFLRDGEWLSAEVIEIADSGIVIPKEAFLEILTSDLT